MKKKKKDGYPSGYYKSEGGVVFHALANPHGGTMSQETLNALSAIADAAQRMVEQVCPQCGNKYGKGLTTHTNEDPTKGAYFICECGWSDKDEQVEP